MFSPIQEEIYESGKDFVITKLDYLLSRCHTDKSKIAFGFVVGITLSQNFEITQKILNQVYPGEQFKILRSLFETIHHLINGNDPNHKIIKAIYDPRLFKAVENESTQTTQQTLVKRSAEKLSADIKLWNHDKYQTGIFKTSDFEKMCASHHAILFSDDAENTSKLSK